MKKSSKVLLSLALAATTAASVGALSSCGGAPAVETVGVYLSDNGIAYNNFLPTYNYFSCAMSGQQLTTYSDNTYALTITTITYSNISTGANVPNDAFTANDKGQTVTTYYGTYTSVEDDGDLNITLSAPTRATYSSFGSAFMDSAVTYGEDKTITTAGANDPISYNDYIASIKAKFNGAEILVNGVQMSFDKVKIG